MRWWGWGDAQHTPTLGPRSLATLSDLVGLATRPRPAVALSHVQIAPSRLDRRTLAGFVEILGQHGVRTDHHARVTHAAGKSYPDLVRMRAGEPQGAPDAVLYPSSEQQLGLILERCQRDSLALVPFGGGTSVVGGLAALTGEHSGLVSLDLGGLAEVARIDRESLILTVGAGMRAVAAERHLARDGLTLGHFPQSFEYVSLGGCAATRSAGQSSTGYGRFEELVQGVRLIAPAGVIALPGHPASAAGPDLRQLLIGSEGVLGVISQLELRVRPAPQQQSFEGVFFEDFASGRTALRELAQEHAAPAITRLSDEAETRISLALAGGGTLKRRFSEFYLAARGYRGGCLAILGHQGSSEQLPAQRRRALEIMRSHGGLPVGETPGRSWAAQRFSAPYLRDELLTHGVMVETLETATRWSNLGHVHREVGAAIAGALGHPRSPTLVLCHVSHLYETGASLYFTIITRQREGAELEQWHELKRAAAEAILANGATITHHHAVGVDHARWLAGEIGQQGVQALRALKSQLDPAGIMNPGKLLV
jgi:alkyldihydroxyacetonephosphate synthase